MRLGRCRGLARWRPAKSLVHRSDPESTATNGPVDRRSIRSGVHSGRMARRRRSAWGMPLPGDRDRRGPVETSGVRRGCGQDVATDGVGGDRSPSDEDPVVGRVLFGQDRSPAGRPAASGRPPARSGLRDGPAGDDRVGPGIEVRARPVGPVAGFRRSSVVGCGSRPRRPTRPVRVGTFSPGYLG